MIAGATDGIGYLLLAHIFTSHMSGNTVAQTLYVAMGRWGEAWRHFEPIVVFFGGILAGLVLSDVLTWKRVARMFSIVAGVEIALLLAFLAVAHPAHQWMVVFPAAAMGIQNAMLRRVGHHRVRTTFITGMITNAAQGLIDAAGARLRGEEDAHKKLGDFFFYGGIWTLFATGGILGAVLKLRFGAVALLLPIGALLVLVAYDLLDPFTSAPEDGEQQGSAA